MSEPAGVMLRDFPLMYVVFAGLVGLMLAVAVFMSGFVSSAFVTGVTLLVLLCWLVARDLRRLRGHELAADIRPHLFVIVAASTVGYIYIYWATNDPWLWVNIVANVLVYTGACLWFSRFLNRHQLAESTVQADR